MATEAATTLHLTRTFNAPRDEVFRAWTEPELIKQWFGPPGISLPEVEVELRVGGEYRFEVKASEEVRRELRQQAGPDAGTYEGEGTHLVGSFLEVIPPQRLVYTFTWDPPPAPVFGSGETVVTVEFNDRGESTELVLTHEKFAEAEVRDFHSFGWAGGLEKLEKLLA
jgi:uncharacterized protein YndB with AHSA1/START domain